MKCSQNNITNDLQGPQPMFLCLCSVDGKGKEGTTQKSGSMSSILCVFYHKGEGCVTVIAISNIAL